MTVVIYQVSPPANGSTENGDISVNAQRTINPISHADMSLLVGQDDSGKLVLSRHMFFRFEVDIPEGEPVVSVKVELASTGVSSGGGMPDMEGGFIVPVERVPGSGLWADAIGLAKWLTEGDCLFAQWDTGGSSDDAVYHGGAPAFRGVAFPTSDTPGEEWSFGDGFSPTTVVAGMAAQLESYLAANESLRGAGNSPTSIPVCFQFFKRYTVPETVEQAVSSSDSDPASVRLHIEWGIDQSPPLRGPVVSTGHTELVVSSDGRLSPLIAS